MRRVAVWTVISACWLLAAAGPARRAAPQDPGQDIMPDPNQAALALRRAMTQTMPYNWTVSEPQTVMDAPQLVIGIPDNWRGSPVSAAMAHCPDADSPLWRNPVLEGQALLRLVIHYHNRDWPPYDCRP